jgi:hypothetical protein
MQADWRSFLSLAGLIAVFVFWQLIHEWVVPRGPLDEVEGRLPRRTPVGVYLAAIFAAGVTWFVSVYLFK